MITYFLLGLAVGAIVGAIGMMIANRTSKNSTEKIFEQLSAKVLNQSMQELVTVAEKQLANQVKLNSKELENKKGLIDMNLKNMNEGLNKVEQLMQEVGKQNTKVETRLGDAAKVITDLNTTTGNLRNALSNTKGRGQWGERMAEDVLRLAGMLEGVNYQKDKRQELNTNRPDFTFMLPQNLKLNMDVKFPFPNYERYVNATTEEEREKFKKQFLKDVRDRVKEIQTRDYINPEDRTVDYVLLFIPNEQIYAFLHEMDRELIDEAMQKRTILCSPLTLYAILAVIRQSIDNFTFESKSQEMLKYLGAFRQQWQKFKEVMGKVGERLDSAQSAYNEMVTTRTNQLDKPLEKLGELRSTEAPPLLEETLENATKKHAAVSAKQ